MISKSNRNHWAILLVFCAVFCVMFFIFNTRQPIVRICNILQERQNTSLEHRLLRALRVVMHLNEKEKKVFSQNGEDGVIEALFQEIGERDKFYMEFGTESCSECNTRYLRDMKGWRGLLMDGGYENPNIGLHKEMIFADNIVQLFKKYNVPNEFDLLSVDTDFKDYWILLAILQEGYRPRVIVIEVNTFLGWERSISVPRNSTQTHWETNTQYFGFSVAAAWKLGRRFGYSLLYCDRIGVNCFFVIDGKDGFGDGVRVSDYLLPQHIFRPTLLRHRSDTRNRPYVDV